MTETSNKPDNRKAPMSKLAIIVFLVSILSVLIVVGFYVGAPIVWKHGFTCLAILAANCVFSLIACRVVLANAKRNNRKLRGQRLAAMGLGISGVAVAILFAMPIIVTATKYFMYKEGRIYRLTCGTNLKGLGVAIRQYASDFDGHYPTANKWCDLLIEHTDVGKHNFECRTAKDSSTYSTSDPNDEPNLPVPVKFFRVYDEPNGQKRYVWSVYWSHYAINPNCEPNSPADVVLLFETKGGWNQFGGPELLTTEHHKGEGCNILFNDGHVEFVETKQLSELRWDNKQKE